MRKSKEDEQIQEIENLAVKRITGGIKEVKKQQE